MINFPINRRDAGRILSSLRAAKNKLEKSVRKFGDDFDPEKGAGILDAIAAYKNLMWRIQEASLDAEDDNSRREASDTD